MQNNQEHDNVVFVLNRYIIIALTYTVYVFMTYYNIFVSNFSLQKQ